MKKIVSCFLAMSMLGALLTGCGNSGSDSPGGDAVSDSSGATAGTLTLATNEDGAAMWEEIATRFNQQYPDIQIEISPFVDYTALNQNVMAAHQAGDDYDLIVVNHTDTLSFIKGELLYPIGDMVKERNIDVDSIIMGNLENMASWAICYIPSRSTPIPGLCW